ncbi:keratin-associated protein family [Trichomonas vaginalis G3]|uniref:keratin-associated protein family n=1 Tax=Trichomonas vaginalis (strain ATCC PRA-98 / G3) TaxID=412133 RepID=UPI0021E559F1|nr:keratin-associated protein family [Trichomonas vaginalis G3]KAI5546572.1 keratin-associated protein family [Trichomonas vaginalis G3]
MIKQQQPHQLKAQSAQVLQTITYAIYAYNSKTAEQTQRLKYGDLEIVLKNDRFEFVCKGGAVISNIKEILFMNSKIKGITDDITSIPPEEQRYYALNAFPKVLKIGRFNLNEEFIEGFLNGIMKKADKEYVDSELEKKADKEYVDSELMKKADKERVVSELEKKANLVYVDEKDNEIKERVEWYHEWTSKILKAKADTGWVSGCLDLKADKTYVNENYAKKTEVNDVITSMKNEILQTLYPVGSIYTSMNSTNPETVLGFGTWKQIVNKFLYCARYSKQAGGSKKIKEANLPPHTHTGTTNFSGDHSHSLRDHPLYNSDYEVGYDVLSPAYNNSTKKVFRKTEPGGNHSHTFTTNPTGLGKDYMPPFVTMFAWYRVY